MSAGPYVMVIDWLPLTPANRWYKGHWSKTATLVTEWKGAAIIAAQLAKLPKGVGSFRLTVQARHRTNHLTDFDAFAPAAKAICDGLVTGPKGGGYGLAADDTPDIALGLTLLPSYLDRLKPDALIVQVVIEDQSPPPVRITEDETNGPVS